MIVTLFVNVALVICFLFIVRAYAARVRIAVPKTAEPVGPRRRRLTKAEMKALRRDFARTESVWSLTNLAHGTKSSMVVATTDGRMVLIPGDGAAFGSGVYATPTGSTAFHYTSGQYYDRHNQQTTIIIIDGQLAKAEDGTMMFHHVGADHFRTNGCGVLLNVVGRENIRTYDRSMLYVYAVPVRLLSPLETETLANKRHFGLTPAPGIKKPDSSAEEMPSRRWWTRPLGLFLAAYFLRTWKKADDYKSGWLGLFLAGRMFRRLLGFGDVIKAPQALVEEAMKNLLIDDWLPADGKGPRRQIRPHYERSRLFWMVGTMTIRQNKDGSWFGRDTYDFHRQYGQGVVAQAGSALVWSYSTLTEDQEAKLRLALRFLDIPSSLYRERNGRLELSNNFWNWLGGQPFQTEVRWKEPRRS